jgi:hypothetical protein
VNAIADEVVRRRKRRVDVYQVNPTSYQAYQR